MRNRALFWTGTSLLVIGLLGAAALAVWATWENSAGQDGPLWSDPPWSDRGWDGTPPSRDGDGDFGTPGEQIYFTGVGSDGPIPRSGGFHMMGTGGCANCHGPDGRGGRIGAMMRGSGIEVPDIRYSTLTSEHVEDGEAEDPWTDEDIATAVREGVEPSGDELDPIMPRWDMNDEDMDDLIAYLKELD